MIKYITNIDKDKITLNLMGREKTFFKNEEVRECLYTKAYPQYFKRIGVIKGYNVYLSSPMFIPDPIQEFVEKEAIRNSEIKEVEIDEIADDVIFETEE